MPLKQTFPVIFFLLAAAWLAACQTEPPVVRSLGMPTEPAPTSVVVAYRTPQPTLTPTSTPVLPTPTEDRDPEFYFGNMLVTMDDVGKIVKLRRGQDFLLTLGDGYTWEITVEPEELITANRKITPEPGDQGVFVARKTGRAVLHAVGSPICRLADQPCARPDLLFQVTILVE